MTLDKFVYLVKPTDLPDAPQTCDKTYRDCLRLNNYPHFGGHTDVNTGRSVPCPHTFGDKACGATIDLSPLKPPYTPPPICEPGCPDHDPPDLPDGCQPSNLDPIGFAPEGQPVYSDDLDVGNGAGALVESGDGFISNVLFPETKDCDVCYGTGRFKGFGGPCSEGCPIKREG